MDHEKHCNTKIIITIEDMRGLWRNLSDSKRIEVIKSIIYTSGDCHGFLEKLKKEICSEKFSYEID